MTQKTRGLFNRVRTLVSDFHPEEIAAYAAGSTLFIIISFFPFVIMLLSLLRFLPFDESAFEHMAFDFIPDVVKKMMVSIVSEISANTSNAVLPIAAVTGLWTASTGFVSISRGLNVAYNRRETRSFLMFRSLCLLYTILFLLVLVTVLAVLVFGNFIFEWMKTSFSFIPSDFSQTAYSRFITAFVVLALFFTLLYKTVPNRKSRWYAEVPGAVFSSGMWMLFSYLYSWYITNFGRSSGVYGSLTAVVFLLMWLYICIYILFIGAYINHLLYHSRLSSKFMKRPEKKGESPE